MWAKSAGANPNFDFLIFSDLPFPTKQYPNIKVIPMTFLELRNLIEKKLQMRVVLDTPYKLCDYKPVYGYVLSDYLNGYDFWGFCDMDLIFGDIGKFIDDRILDKYDKILHQGHFSLNRNNDKMNRMFLRCFKNVINYKFAFSTRFNCHFDENGTLAYCNEYDASVKYFFKWIFADTNFLSYRFMAHGTEAAFLWDDGKLTMYWNEGNNSEEIMYVHLQKRKMHREIQAMPEKFAIVRDAFLSVDEDTVENLLKAPINQEKERLFNKQIAQRMKKIRREKLKNGWLNVKMHSLLFGWRSQKDLSCTPLQE